MSSSKSSGHFWPAYVDLMTVLLMVFLLLTLLFQMVASIARMQEGLKVKTAAPMASEATARPGSLMLTFASADAALQAGQRDEARAWLLANLAGIAEHGLSISARIPANEGEVSRRLSAQFSRVLQIKQLATEMQVDERKLYIVNQLDVGLQTAGQIQLAVGRL